MPIPHCPDNDECPCKCKKTEPARLCELFHGLRPAWATIVYPISKNLNQSQTNENKTKQKTKSEEEISFAGTTAGCVEAEEQRICGQTGASRGVAYDGRLLLSFKRREIKADSTTGLEHKDFPHGVSLFHEHKLR